jgi:mRNA-degrading endonuclease toxin of MazEF toxin-antitoxin module
MIKQGYLYWGDVPKEGMPSGRLTRKRPYLVLSNDQANNISVIVAPLTSAKNSVLTNVKISREYYPIKDGYILLNNISTINKDYLLEEICQLRGEDSNKVKETLKLLFTL